MVSSDISRVNALFPNANGRFAIRMAKNLEMAIRKIASELSTLFVPSEHLATITKLILPQDDSALVLTEVRYGIDVELESALNDLYHDMVEKYLNEKHGSIPQVMMKYGKKMIF